jgi:adenine-specific DNA methylase
MYYLLFYHFLEGLANYERWPTMISLVTGKTKRPDDSAEVDHWAKKGQVAPSFEKLIERFQDNIIVLSYQSDGIPSRQAIIKILRRYKKQIAVHSRPARYVLSKTPKRELLFIAR